MENDSVYTVSTFGRNFYRGLCIILVPSILISGFLHEYYLLSSWTMISFLTPLIASIVWTIILFFLPSAFATSEEERSKAYLNRNTKIAAFLNIILLGILLVITFVSSPVNTNWWPDEITAPCSLATPAGTFPIKQVDKFFGLHTSFEFSTCYFVPVIDISFLIIIVALIGILCTLLRDRKVRSHINLQNPNEELHLKSNVGDFDKHQWIFLICTILVFFLLAAVSILLMLNT